MRIVIPKGVYSNNGYVDVHIATPYGVSPHLAIPILCDTKVAAPTYGYAVDDNSKVTINYTLLPRFERGNLTYDLVFVGNDKKDTIYIDWSSPTGSILSTARADFLFTFQSQDLQTFPIPVIAAKSSQDKAGGGNGGKDGGGPKTKGGFFEISGFDLSNMSGFLVDQLRNNSKALGLANSLPSSLTTKSITIRLNDGTDHVTQAVPTSNQLTVQFKYVSPAGSLENERKENKIILEVDQKDNKVIFSPVQTQSLGRLRLNMPGIDNKEIATLRIRFQGFDPRQELIDIDFAPRPNAPTYYEINGQNLTIAKTAIEDAINFHYNQLPVLGANAVGLLSSPSPWLAVFTFLSAKEKSIPSAIQSERLTVYFKRGRYQSNNEIDLTGSLTIQPKK